MGMHSVGRVTRLLCLPSLLSLLAGCNDILKVNNPQQVPLDQLNDPALLNVQVNGVINELEEAYTRINGAVLWSANFLTDEQVTGINWEDFARVNQRIVNYTEGPVFSLWSHLSRIVRLGEDVTARLEALKGANDKRIATTAVLAGYGYLFIGESMCHAVFGTVEKPGDSIIFPPEVFQRAIPWFQRAIQVATATGQPNIVNLAHVGLARTYLNLKDFANTIAEASLVTDPGFKYWVEYSAVQEAENDGLSGRSHGANHTMGVSPFFLQGTFGTQGLVATQTDPRIQHTTRWTFGHNGLTKLYKPYQGLRFSGYTGQTIADSSASCPTCSGAVPDPTGDKGPLLLYQKDTKVLLADYLEAQHDLYEAMLRQAINDSAVNQTVNQFVNARRAVGNEPPVTLTDTALFHELRVQRSRDFYQGGLRLGDLRRWKRDGVGDFFPTGNHVNLEWGAYGIWTCFPLPLEEYQGNKNITPPPNPLIPPGI
jgi:hypothetical protein